MSPLIVFLSNSDGINVFGHKLLLQAHLPMAEHLQPGWTQRNSHHLGLPLKVIDTATSRVLRLILRCKTHAFLS